MKFLIYLVLFYFAYRMFIRPMLPAGKKEIPPRRRHTGGHRDTSPDDDSEYVEYEEVE